MDDTSQYLTADLPGTGGTIKQEPGDFIVEEISLYLPEGAGEHTYALIEKRGITTLEAVRRIARALDVPEREIGYAGMKDARGITRQTVSIPRVAPDRVMALTLPGLAVVSAALHRNKLRLGHLAGNHFRIRVRETLPDAVERAEAILAVLGQRGVPNFFGEQRYGAQGNSHRIGRALLARDWRSAVDALLGDPVSIRDEEWRAAVALYRQGDLTGCLAALPRHCRTEREVVQRLARHPGEWEKAVLAVHPRLRTLYLNACQSALFDRVLAERLATFDRVEAGDLAWKHVNGACFLVEDVTAEAGRAERFEISATGPLFGVKMTQSAGGPLAREEAVLAAEGLNRESFAGPGWLRLEGERRPLRVPLREASVSVDENGLVVRFVLPRGAYATTVLRELMKTECSVPGDD